MYCVNGIVFHISHYSSSIFWKVSCMFWSDEGLGLCVSAAGLFCDPSVDGAVLVYPEDSV